MPTLFIDIDNTLIYSHRHYMAAPKLVVEELNGREQSYISEETYAFFRNRQDLQLIPVTTRSLLQFRRLEKLIADLKCEYSLICNGAVLLHNMEPDEKWLEESQYLAGQELPEVAKAEKWLTEMCGQLSTHSVSGLYVYAKTNDSYSLRSTLQQVIAQEKVDVLADHNKLYCIPKSLNKGSAVKRFTERFWIPFSVAAGDSEFDIPMLNQVNIAIAPESLSEKLTNKNKVIVQACGHFSDEICSALSRIPLCTIEKNDLK